MLETTPAEVLAMIIAEVTDVKDLHNLCRASRQLYDAAMPFLYETVDITTPETALEHVGRGRFRDSSGSHLRLTKYLRLSAPFRNILSERCFHPSADDTDDTNDTDETDDTDSESEERGDVAEEIGRNILPILGHLSDDQLRGFSWNLGTCVPMSLFGHDGYLSRRQTRMERLSLITDCQCHYYPQEKRHGAIELSTFNNICVFSWIGAKSFDDFHALQTCLFLNASHLTSLTLDLIDWNEYDGPRYMEVLRGPRARTSHFLAKDIFRIEEGSGEKLFPSLDALCLSNISFEGAANDMARGFNVETLQKLKLWDCPHSLKFLNQIVEHNTSLRLVSFEFVVTCDFEIYRNNDYLEDLHPFLEAFRGLEDVYILGSAPLISESLTRAALNHDSTLSRFVLHSRRINTQRNSHRFDKPMDSLVDWSPELENILLLPKLECIGFSIDIPILRRQLSYLSARPSCKLLHIRASGSSELDDNGWIERAESLSARHPDDDIEPLPEDEVEDYDDSEDTGSGDDWTDWSELSSDENEVIDKVSRSQMDKGEVALDDLSREPGSLLDFAQWAFGPEGLPNLEFLVYGDFCHQGRYARHNIMLRRNLHFTEDSNPSTSGSEQFNPTYCLLRRGDDGFSRLYRLHGDFLEACAAEDLMCPQLS